MTDSTLINVSLTLDEAKALRKYINYAESVATYKTEEEISDMEIMHADDAKRKLVKGIQGYNGRINRMDKSNKGKV